MCVEWHFDRAENLPSLGLYNRGRVPLQSPPKRIVCREEKPGRATGFYDGRPGAVCEFPRVVGPVDCVGRAFGAGQIRGAEPESIKTLFFSRVIAEMAKATPEF